MCKGIGLILTKNEVYFCEDFQSHEEIKERHKLKDTNSENLVPVEMYPRGKNILSYKHEDWEINFENKPAWLNNDIEEYKDKCYKVLFEKIISVWKETKLIKSEIDLNNLGYKILPDFGDIKVGGGFNCSFNQLTSLAGAPKEVGGGFNCFSNQLTSLAGAPREVGGGFNCFFNPKLKETYQEYKQKKKVRKSAKQKIEEYLKRKTEIKKEYDPDNPGHERDIKE